MVNSRIDDAAAYGLAAGLPDIERQVIQALDNRPGTLLDVAVRVRKFPEDVEGPLQDLGDRSLVQMSTLADSSLFQLTPLGQQVSSVVKQPEFRRERRSAEGGGITQAMALPQVSTPAAPDPRRERYDLLLQLAALAKQQGDLATATQHYEEALAILQQLTSTP